MGNCFLDGHSNCQGVLATDATGIKPMPIQVSGSTARCKMWLPCRKVGSWGSDHPQRETFSQTPGRCLSFHTNFAISTDFVTDGIAHSLLRGSRNLKCLFHAFSRHLGIQCMATKCGKPLDFKARMKMYEAIFQTSDFQPLQTHRQASESLAGLYASFLSAQSLVSQEELEAAD